MKLLTRLRRPYLFFAFIAFRDRFAFRWNDTTWRRIEPYFGVTDGDSANSVQQTADGGYKSSRTSDPNSLGRLQDIGDFGAEGGNLCLHKLHRICLCGRLEDRYCYSQLILLMVKYIFNKQDKLTLYKR